MGSERPYPFNEDYIRQGRGKTSQVLLTGSERESPDRSQETQVLTVTTGQFAFLERGFGRSNVQRLVEIL